MKQTAWIGMGVGLIAAIFTAGGSIWAAGAGHGSYVPAIILFPVAMLSTAITTTISPLGVALALAQFPIYGFLIGNISRALRLRLGIALAVIHLTCAVMTFVILRGGPFVSVGQPPHSGSLWLASSAFGNVSVGRPTTPHKLTSRRSVGSAAEPPWAAPNCSSSRWLHLAPSELSFSRGSHRAAVRQACEAACSLE